MDRYAEKCGELADRVWEAEYLKMRDAIEGNPGAVLRFAHKVAYHTRRINSNHLLSNQF